MADIVFDPTILVAFDFDGTLTCKDVLFGDFELNVEALDYVRRIQQLPVKTILWSCRHGSSLDIAVSALAEVGIRFDYVNVDNEKRNSGRKINADVYIDDKANDGVIHWEAIYNRIVKLVEGGKECIM